MWRKFVYRLSHGKTANNITPKIRKGISCWLMYLILVLGKYEHTGILNSPPTVDTLNLQLHREQLL